MREGVVMKRTIGAATVLLGVLLLALPVFASTNSKTAKKPSGAITIESWLSANPAPTQLSGTVKACFKLKGVLVDRGGEPTWSNSTSYANVPNPVTDLSKKCDDWTPVGGFSFVPPASGNPNLMTLYAVHTITGKKGQIFITFAGAYNFSGAELAGIANMKGHGTWVITGGTGAYVGLQGEGLWDADANTIGNGYIRHDEQGEVHWN
jgi:hypothetical protein